MKFVACLTLLLAAAAFSQDPSNILIYMDVSGGYGEAVVTACNNLWPSCNVYPATGQPGGMYTQFNDALATGPWDIVVVESWYADCDGLDWAGISSYYNGGGTLYVSTWEWTGGSSGQGVLGNDMGVTAYSNIQGGVIPHYAWDTGHPICDGISDWGWADPGLGILNCRFTVDSATPITGWTSSPSAGQAALCVAEDGKSIISGFTLAYANEGVAIWENVLDFMWTGSPLERTTWGEIKSSF
ncbi:MAG TPA: hypothetical protein PK991_12135 [Candidatus Sabulitectum sp.]|nr:hypothetical protein [Candidatus Sabulitectum sp.]